MEYPVLSRVSFPTDLRKLNINELKTLCNELRDFILKVVSKNGGHLGPNLGVIELSVALHYTFDSPKDKIVWDVSHQSYSHKILTGRRDVFPSLRKFKGICGFTRRGESPDDVFGAGHASTALSAALGIATARDLAKDKYKVIAVVGDGSLTGGMAWEALNQIGALKKDILIILNDNKMSIAENVGAISNYLVRLQTSSIYNRIRDDVWELIGRIPSDTLSQRAKDMVRKLKESLENLLVPSILFEELGIRYFGPLDGHDLPNLISVLKRLRNIKGSILLHLVTEKGRGYKPALQDPESFHGLGSFDVTTGEPVSKHGEPPYYTEIFGRTIVEIGERDDKVVAITAAMPKGTGLKTFKKRFPDRFFDVGIAEQHAVTFAAGLATQGYKPFCAIYSTFLQRAFDQIIHDVALQKLPVRFALDRGGLVGEDGPTHHGVFDLSYLNLIPGIVIMAPKDEDEMRDMLWTAVKYEKGPIALRYPRDRGTGVNIKRTPKCVPIGKAEVLKDGSNILFLAIGTMVYPALQAAWELETEFSCSIAVVNARFVKPLDINTILHYIERGVKIIVTIEENTISGGFGSAVQTAIARCGVVSPHIIQLGIPDNFIEHGPRRVLLETIGLTKKGIVNSTRDSIIQEVLCSVKSVK